MQITRPREQIIADIVRPPPRPARSADLRALLDATSESAFLLDPDGRFVAVNRVAAARLGLRRREMIGRCAFDIWPPEVAALRSVPFREAVESGEAVSFCDERDGRSFEITYQPVRDGDGPARIAVFAREMTGERQLIAALAAAQAQYRDAFENAVVGMFRTTPDGRYLAANRALARMYGFADPEQLKAELTDIGAQLYVERDRREAFRRRLIENDAVRGFESEIRRRDGSVAWIAESARAVRDAAGALLYYEGMVEDVTEAKRVRQAEAAAQAKANFLANMSHELRTPLNAVLGFSDVMVSELFGPLPPRYRDYAGLIHEAGSHLLRLINDVLDLAKVDAGRLDLRDEILSVPELIAACLHLVREAAERGGVRIEVAVREPLPRVRGDGLRLKQILLNLLSNAVKFTPAGGTVAVRAEVGPAGLTVAVQDTGPGIAAADLERVMEPFSQADTARAHEGTGLGLPLARRLAELHGGSLDLESAPGQGTTARLRLPAERLVG